MCCVYSSSARQATGVAENASHDHRPVRAQVGSAACLMLLGLTLSSTLSLVSLFVFSFPLLLCLSRCSACAILLALCCFFCFVCLRLRPLPTSIAKIQSFQLCQRRDVDALACPLAKEKLGAWARGRAHRREAWWSELSMQHAVFFDFRREECGQRAEEQSPRVRSDRRSLLASGIHKNRRKTNEKHR
jgi:hypothetical protein